MIMFDSDCSFFSKDFDAIWWPLMIVARDFLENYRCAFSRGYKNTERSVNVFKLIF